MPVHYNTVLLLLLYIYILNGDIVKDNPREVRAIIIPIRGVEQCFK